MEHHGLVSTAADCLQDEGLDADVIEEYEQSFAGLAGPPDHCTYEPLDDVVEQDTIQDGRGWLAEWHEIVPKAEPAAAGIEFSDKIDQYSEDLGYL